MLFRKESNRLQRNNSFSHKERYRLSVWKLFRAILFLILHFMVVVAVLCTASVVFAQIEDPTPITKILISNSTRQSKDGFVGTKMLEEKFWDSLKTKYNINVNEIDKISMMDDWKSYLNDLSEKINDEALKKQRNDRIFVHKKWFYFSSITATTVGYGDVTPITQDGRLIYIIFSIISIPLMLSFIVSCGDKIRLLHTGLLSMLRQCISGHKKSVNEHFLSSILMFISFAGHVSVGCALFGGGNSNRTTVDKLYHHLGLFTTVGLGDVVEPLEYQAANVTQFFFYRVFGFALLFGALKSLYCWYQARHEALAVLRLTQRPLKARGRISNLPCCRPKLREEPKLESTMLI